MNEGELVWIEAIGEAVPRSELAQRPELLDHEHVMQRRHEQWLRDAEDRRREREQAELEAEREEIEGGLPTSVHRHARSGSEGVPHEFPRSQKRSEAEIEAFRGEPDPHSSEAKTGAEVRLGTPPGGNARYCHHCRAQLPEVKRRRGSVQQFCAPKCRAAWHRARRKAAAARAGVSLVDAMDDPKIFGAAIRDKETWGAWRVLLKSMDVVPLEPDEYEVFRRHTGRTAVPQSPVSTVFCIAGRRARKTFIGAMVTVARACLGDYHGVLGPGERGLCMLLAADRRQARVALRYVTGILDSSPLLSSMIEDRLKDTIRLNNGVDIEIHTSSFRAVRGYSIISAVCDEIAFWRSEDSANPDKEVINALRPGMAGIPNPLLFCISSPYGRSGALWDAHQRHYGKNGDVLVWQSDTVSMNPTIAQDVIDEAYERDASVAAAEYGGQFRVDVELFITREAVDAVVVEGRLELPPSGRRYAAFVDPSGGSHDSFTLGVAHEEEGRRVLDLVRERKPPFSPEDVVREFSEILRLYRVTEVHGDRYSGEFVVEQFRKCGIAYKASSRTKSEIYGELLPLINSRQVELLDDGRLIAADAESGAPDL